MHKGKNMEDDEEYSYRAYSPRTEKYLNEEATFRDNEEVFTYSGYSIADELTAEEVERSTSYGDFLVEEFSPEVTVPRFAKITKLPTNIATYIIAALYFIVGMLCVSITNQIIESLPYIVGGAMVLVGLLRFISALRKREYRHTKTNHTATSLILTAVGIMVVVEHFLEHDAAITFISIAWGIMGLFESAHAFNHAFKRIANSERCIYYIIRGVIELIVAFMLLYQPDSHSAHNFHIIVFGVNLIFDSITMIPQVKSFLAMK